MKMKRIMSSILAATILFGTVGTVSAGVATDSMFDAFQKPSIDYKSRPLWFWNGIDDSSKMDKQWLKDTVNGSFGSGYSGFGILPYGQGGYLGQDYFDMYRVVLEECKKNGMKLNLYDENGFPSGPAGGLFAQTYPQDTAKALYKNEVDIKGPKKGKIPISMGTENEPFMGAVAMNMETKELIELTPEVGSEVQRTPIKTTTSSNFQNLEAYDANKATDGDPATRWNAGDKSGNDEWLQIEFEKPMTFNGATIQEAFDRTTSYHIQYWDGTGWVDAVSGTTIGANKSDSFDTVTSNKVRLCIDTIKDPTINSVSIWEFDILMDDESLIGSGGDYVRYDLDEGDWKVMTFNVRRDGNSFCDYLNSDSVSKFIDLTHEKYYEEFPEYFGDVIDMTFYDEPAMWRTNTWTESYNEKFEDQKGFSPVKYYPALWYDIGEDTSYARNELFGFRADLFADGFVKTLNDWCVEHDIKLTGHVGEEELINPTSTAGDLMKTFRDQEIPGIDSVIFYGRISRALKVVSSSANNYDKQKVMTEIHGASDTLDVPTMYRDVMDHFAKGINLMVPHAVWYKPYGPGFMNPELSFRDPKWGPILPAYNEYIGRAGSILQEEGRHVADIGVVYPIDSLQNDFRFNGGYDAYKGGITPKAEWNYMDIGEMLSLDIRRDFTYLHPDVIDEKCEVIDNTIKMNNEMNWEQYKTIIIPGGNTISLSNLEKIKAFYDNGGLVIGSRQLPYMSSEQGQSDRVVEIIKEMFGVDPRTSTGPIYTSSSQYEVQWMGDTIGLEPWKAGDDNANSRWESNTGTNEWLQVDFNAPVDVAKAVINERTNGVTKHNIQYWDQATESWTELANGTTIGTSKTYDFTPVTSTKIRLNIPTANGRIGISEFKLFDSDGNNLIFPESVSKANAKGGNAVYVPNASADILKVALDSTDMVYDLNFDEEIKTTGGNLSYIHKVVNDRDTYFIANSSDNNLNTTVTLRGTLESPAVWNPHNGEKYKVPFEHTTQNGVPVTKVTLRMAAVQSLFVVDDDTAPTILFTEALKKAVDSAKAIDQFRVTPTSYAPVQRGITEAEKLIVNDKATQTAIDACEQRLTKAIAQVVYTNLAYGKTATASSSIEGSNFFMKHITDGNNKTMYSSSAQLGAQHEEWITIDLGTPTDIARMDITPRSDPPYEGLFYPIDYQIQVSNDKEEWTTISTIEDAEFKADTTPRIHKFDTANARYVRVLVTELRSHKGIDPSYRLQVSEIEVFAPQAAVVESNKTTLKLVLDYANQAVLDGKTDNLIPAVLAKFNSALDHAQTVYDDPSSTQTTVDQAWVMLMDAIHMLSFEKGDKAALNMSIIAAQGLNLDDYQNTATLVSALAQAIAVYKDPNALQNEVDKARITLDEAVSKLVLKDKTQLIVVIGQADNVELELDRYVEAGKAEFTTALETARKVLSNPKSTQSEIDTATSDLLVAMVNLRYKADKATLEDVLAKANAIDLTLYTEASAEPFKRALKSAQDTFDNPEISTANQKDIDWLVEQLNNTIQSLKPINTPIEAAGTEPIPTDTSPTTGEHSLPITMAMAAIGAIMILKKKKR